MYVIIFIRPFTAHKSIFHISSHARGDVIFVNCVLTLAIPFLFSCNCARPVNLGWWEQRHKGRGEEEEEDGGAEDRGENLQSAASVWLGGAGSFFRYVLQH